MIRDPNWATPLLLPATAEMFHIIAMVWVSKCQAIFSCCLMALIAFNQCTQGVSHHSSVFLISDCCKHNNALSWFTRSCCWLMYAVQDRNSSVLSWCSRCGWRKNKLASVWGFNVSGAGWCVFSEGKGWIWKGRQVVWIKNCDSGAVTAMQNVMFGAPNHVHDYRLTGIHANCLEWVVVMSPI